MGWFGPSKDKKLLQAAWDGNEAELTRLIERGGNVNWHNPEVRRRMCLAWAPASSPPLLLRSPSPPRQRPPCAVSPQPRRRWPSAAASPPRRAWHTRPRRMARAAPPRARPRSSRALALDDAACASFATERSHRTDTCLRERARRVRPPPPRGRGHRGQRQGKPRVCPPPAHAMDPLPCSHSVAGLSCVLRTSTIGQHCIGRHTTATSRSPSAFSKGAPM